MRSWATCASCTNPASSSFTFERAEHIAWTVALEEVRVWPPTPEGVHPPEELPPHRVYETQLLAAAPLAPSRWRDVCGWLGILAGTAVFVRGAGGSAG